MMRALVRREAARVVESGGFSAAIWAHATWLAAFLAVWGRTTGTPFISGASIYEQAALVQWIGIVAILPWAAARCVADERGNGIVTTAAFLGLAPSRILVARALALSAAIVCVIAAGFPLIVIAARMSDVWGLRILFDQSVVIAFGLAVAAVATALQQSVAGRLVMWLTTTAIACAGIAVLRATGASAAAGAAALTLIAIGAAALGVRRDVSLRYLTEGAV